ncbi:hypothetical protein H072_1262 [Dactylellina haptotyla CBS 200.50]|uniref:F-box domain-containing protein n=1 Tax=Dactylellina haptotyla (strain CBS 200.50) TaxID=1284197 RepID=S8AUX8_DACHA|nr:hypothetical protein H072_1262 [Dactylellina haptotyla CBS 200.50]
MNHITSLPIELRIKILRHLESPPSLLAAITASRSFHDAYLESQTSIRTHILLNSTDTDSTHCKFLTYALIVFHNKPFIHLPQLHRFTRAYLNFANPQEGIFSPQPCKAVPWEKCAPPSFHDKKWDVHRHIYRWAEKFCEEKLARLYLDPTGVTTTEEWDSGYEGSDVGAEASSLSREGYKHASAGEIARASRAFYQYFLYTLLSTDNFFYSGGMDNLGRPVTQRPDEDILLAFVEAMPYVDYMVVYRLIIDWMVELVKPLVVEMIKDVKNPVRTAPARWGLSAAALEQRVGAVTQALITRLGPVELWKFVFESTYERQFEVYCQHPTALDRESFAPWETFEVLRMKTEAYDPKARICTDEGGKCLKEDGYTWWQKEGVLREGLLWEESRLIEKGFVFPKEPDDAEWFKKGTRWRDREFRLAECEFTDEYFN